jgi:hypothetical protein
MHKARQVYLRNWGISYEKCQPFNSLDLMYLVNLKALMH